MTQIFFVSHYKTMQASSENSQSDIEDKVVEEKVKKERSLAQQQVLLKAREKALEVRKMNADVRRKEKQINAEKEKALKNEKHKQIESEYNELMSQHNRTADKTKSSDDEEEIVRRPRKTRRRIVVVQSSDTEEEEIEVKLPKQKKQIEPDERQKKYERSMHKLFTLD